MTPSPRDLEAAREFFECHVAKSCVGNEDSIFHSNACRESFRGCDRLAAFRAAAREEERFAILDIVVSFKDAACRPGANTVRIAYAIRSRP